MGGWEREGGREQARGQLKTGDTKKRKRGRKKKERGEKEGVGKEEEGRKDIKRWEEGKNGDRKGEREERIMRGGKEAGADI